MDLVVVIDELGRHDRSDDLFDEVGSDHRVPVDPVVVLGRDEHLAKAHRPVALVLECDLGLGVGAQVRDGPCLADLGVAFGHAVRQVDGQRHEHVGLVAGEAEHHPLVTSALAVQLVILAGGPRPHLLGVVHAPGDVAGLGVQGDHDAAGVAVEAEVLAVVADLADRLANGLRDVHVLRRGHLSGDHHEPGGDHRLAGHPALWILLEHGVQDGVRDLVGHLVGMPLGDRLGGEGPVPGHVSSPFVDRFVL